MAGSIYALVVGIDAYQAVRPLRGCKNDAQRVAELLRVHAGPRPIDVATLFDAEATRQAIVDRFRSHLGQAGEGDLAVFTYAGHGSQEGVPPELAALEPDGLNETLVCVDSRTDEVPWDLADKELNALIAEVVAKGAEVVCLFDCCHSGSASREPLEVERSDERAVDPAYGPDGEPAVRPFDSYLPDVRAFGEGDRGVGAETALTGPRHLALSACQSDQTAKEVDLGGTKRGAFSAALEEALAAGGPGVTYRGLVRAARARVPQLARKQDPTWYATVDTDLDRPFLGVDRGSAAGSFVLAASGDGWQIDGGSLHGIRPPVDGRPTRLRVLDGDEVLGMVDVGTVEPTRSTVTPAGDLSLDSARQYGAVLAELPLPPVVVELGGADAGAVSLAETALAGLASPLLSRQPVPGARTLVVDTHDGQYVIAAPDGAPIVASAGTTDPEGAAELATRLDHLARWYRVLDLENPGSPLANQVDVEWVEVRPGDTTLPLEREPSQPDEREGALTVAYVWEGGQARPGRWFLRIANRSGRPLYAVLLDLTDEYSISDVLYRAGSEKVGPDRPAAAFEGDPIDFMLPSDRQVEPGSVARDWLKLIVSDQPIDASLLNLSSMDEAVTRGVERGEPAPALESSADVLERTLGGPKVTLVSVADWAALTVPIAITVPEPTG